MNKDSNDIASACEILLVEDDPDVRLSMSQALSLAGYQVREYGSAPEALARIDPMSFQIVVSDVRLPGMSGLDFLREAQKQDPTLSIVIITGHGDISMAVEAMRNGAVDFIEKPIASERIASAVSRAVAFKYRKMCARFPDISQESIHEIETIIVGSTPQIDALRRTILGLASINPDVLISGETGVGKDLVAQCLHNFSSRASGNFVAVNCAAIPDTMFESELFGHEQGAFTGAHRRRLGKMEFASGGTLFLDEIDAMPLGLQAKLLRAIQDRRIERLGSNQPIALDLRVIAATKANLLEAAERKCFRSDLYYRLNVVNIEVPALRDRREDIPTLFEYFVSRAASRYGREAPAIGEAMMEEIAAGEWLGNVRELRNVAERFVVGIVGGLPGYSPKPETKSLADLMAGYEQRILLGALRRNGGHVASASAELGISRKTLYEKIARHKIRPL